MDTPKHVKHPRDFEPCQGRGVRNPANYLEILPANPAQYDCGQGRDRAVSGSLVGALRSHVVSAP